MRKPILSFLALFLALSILPLAAAPVRLLMWGGVPPESGPQAVCDAFNKEFASKGISIEYERFVNDDQGNMKLETNLLAGEPAVVTRLQTELLQIRAAKR